MMGGELRRYTRVEGLSGGAVRVRPQTTEIRAMKMDGGTVNMKDTNTSVYTISRETR